MLQTNFEFCSQVTLRLDELEKQLIVSLCFTVDKRPYRSKESLRSYFVFKPLIQPNKHINTNPVGCGPMCPSVFRNALPTMFIQKK